MASILLLFLAGVLIRSVAFEQTLTIRRTEDKRGRSFMSLVNPDFSFSATCGLKRFGSG